MLLKILKLLAIALAVLVLLLMLFENKLIYLPWKFPQGNWEEIQREKNPPEDVFLQTEDGVKIHGWFVSGENAKASILYFHGNAGNISNRYDWVKDLSRLPANVFIIDYRGYGKSEGRPSEGGIYLDAQAAYRYLIEKRKIDPKTLVIYGKSIGGGPACELASKFPCAGLILQSPFTSIKDMADRLIPPLPLRWIARTRFDNLGKIQKITVPKLIIHSRNDEVIPFWMSEKLFQAAPEPKQFQTYSRAGHNDLIGIEHDDLLKLFGEFLDRL